MWVGILHRPIWPSQVNAGVCGLIMTDSIIGFLCFLISAASASFILPQWNWFYSCIQSNKAVANSSVVWLTVVFAACRHALRISSACWKKLVLPPFVLASWLVYLHRIMGGSTINTFIVLTCREYLCVLVVRHGCHKPSGSLWEIPGWKPFDMWLPDYQLA